MTTRVGETREKASVLLDDSAFVNCEYIDCDLIFGGGDVSLINCKLEKCRVMLVGAAAKTASMLQVFGWKPPERPEVNAHVPGDLIN